MCPKQGKGILPETFTSSRKTRLHSTFTRRNGCSGCVNKRAGGKRVCGRFQSESMHMVSKRDLTSAELETMRRSRSRTSVMTANGEVQTREETTAHVKLLDLFFTVMLLEETHAPLSLGKLCEDHGYTYHWTSGQKPPLIRNGRRIDCNISN